VSHPIVLQVLLPALATLLTLGIVALIGRVVKKEDQVMADVQRRLQALETGAPLQDGKLAVHDTLISRIDADLKEMKGTFEKQFERLHDRLDQIFSTLKERQ